MSSTNESSSNNDTTTTTVNESNSFTSDNFRVTRNTPYGKVSTEEGYITSQERFEDHQTPYSMGREQTAQERQQQKGRPEWPGRSVHRIWNDNISWRLQTFAMPAKREVLERLSEHKYKIENNREYREEFVKALEEDRGSIYRNILQALDEDIKINAAIRAEIQRFYAIIDDDKKERRLQQLYEKVKSQTK